MNFTENSNLYKRNYILLIAALLIVLLAEMIFASSVGAVHVPFREVYRIIAGQLFSIFDLRPASELETSSYIIWQVRLPRVLLSALVGASLAISGAILQGVFKNPMAEPYIIGVSFGGAFGATLVILFGTGFGLVTTFSIPLFAFTGALIASFAVYHLARVGSRVPVSSLILSGIAISSFLSALISLMMAFKGRDLYTLVFWLMGGFSARNWYHVGMVLPFLVVAFPVVFAFARELNVMLLGDERAKQLGIDVERTKKYLIVASALLAGAAVSVSGLIGFVGLIIPHVVRLIIGPDHRLLIPCVTLSGALFLVFADTLSRVLIPPAEIPVGIITALFGAPFFIYLLRAKRGSLG